jgi:predicted tellurium resistance membrane protein TerC
LIDIVFSVDSIITAVGMTDHFPIMVVAVVVSVGVRSGSSSTAFPRS